MKHWKLWGSLAAIVILVGAGLYGWWALDLRWRPHTITKNQAQISQLLEHAGWVSPGRPGAKLYMVSFRSCPDCIRFETNEFPRLEKAGVDTRVILIARKDYNGLAKSTPAERTTVAELWIDRNWNLLQAWQSVPPEAWTAPGLVPADGDTARTAVVEGARAFVEQLQPLLAANGVDNHGFRYPTLVWWDKQGRMRACACEKAQTYRFVRRELGA